MPLTGILEFALRNEGKIKEPQDNPCTSSNMAIPNK
jgi:hypothetical protein